MLAEPSRAIGCINYSFIMGFVLLKELKKKLLGPKCILCNKRLILLAGMAQKAYNKVKHLV